LAAAESVTLTGLTHFTGGNACGPGGGIYVGGGSITITSSNLSTNSMSGTCVGSAVQPTVVEQFGGAVFVNNGNATITSSTFSGNHALEGGGAVAVAGNATVTGSTFTGNTAGETSACNSGCFGGALIVENTATVTGSTFTSNALSAANG